MMGLSRWPFHSYHFNSLSNLPSNVIRTYEKVAYIPRIIQNGNRCALSLWKCSTYAHANCTKIVDAGFKPSAPMGEASVDKLRKKCSSLVGNLYMCMVCVCMYFFLFFQNLEFVLEKGDAF